MPPKKTVIAAPKVLKKKPAKAFVAPPEEFEDDVEVQDEEVVQPAQRKGEKKQTLRRPALNHAVAAAGVEMDGMKFSRSRGLLDGTTKKTLDIDQTILNPSLSYYWTNDEKGLVDQRIEIGYQVVPQLLSRNGEKITTRRRVGTQKDGSPLEAVLMATPKNWKKERQDAQEAQRQKLEGSLQAGETDGKEDLGKGFYIHEDTEFN